MPRKPLGRLRPRTTTGPMAAVAGGNPSAAELRDILFDTRTVAVVGASNNPSRPSNDVFEYLLRHSRYELYPVKPQHHRNRRHKGLSPTRRSAGGSGYGGRLPAPR